jgi:hypothetical protein
MELQLLLKLNDQVSRGASAALRTVQRESRNTTRDLNGIAAAANRIRPTGIERMTSALRQMQRAAKSSLEMLQKGAQFGAGLAAGGYVLKQAAARPMAFDRRLALLANTAYSDQGVSGRIAGKAQLRSSIRAAVNYGGGNPEQAADTLNTLVGSGAFGQGRSGINNSLKLLPTLLRASSGTGADANDLARIAIAGKQNLGLTDDEMPAAIAKAIRAGQEGGFELNDMARWLPQQMALAATNGMRGMKGFEDLLAYNQVSRITAGSSDEAGNNLVNLLAKMNSRDTQLDMKKQGIDLSGSLAAARGKGVGTLDAFVSIISQLGMRDKRYVELRNKSANETGADQKATFEAMADILLAKGLGESIQDRQALTALIAAIQQPAMRQNVGRVVSAENGQELFDSFATVADTSDYKSEQVGNKGAFAAMDALSAADGPLKKVLDWANGAATEFPKTTAAATALAVALTAAAAAATGFSLVGKLPGKGPKLPPGAPAPSGGSLNSSLGMKPGSAPAGGGLLSRMGLLGIPWIAALAGVKGTDEFFKSDSAAGMNEQRQKQLDQMSKALGLQPIKVIVEVKNGNIVAAVNEHNSRQASRH